MSLTNDERTTLVTLELKKARDTFEEITILTAANKWSVTHGGMSGRAAQQLIDSLS